MGRTQRFRDRQRTVVDELPVVSSVAAPAVATRDLARGWTWLLLWAPPIGTILAGSLLGGLRWLTLPEAGLLSVGGTAWLGATCLVNAQRCGRTHCWIMGILLPVLAGVGALTLLGVLDFPWSTFGSAVWVIILGAFVVEWMSAPYLLG